MGEEGSRGSLGKGVDREGWERDSRSGWAAAGSPLPAAAPGDATRSARDWPGACRPPSRAGVAGFSGDTLLLLLWFRLVFQKLKRLNIDSKVWVVFPPTLGEVGFQPWLDRPSTVCPCGTLERFRVLTLESASQTPGSLNTRGARCSKSAWMPAPGSPHPGGDFSDWRMIPPSGTYRGSS